MKRAIKQHFGISQFTLWNAVFWIVIISILYFSSVRSTDDLFGIDAFYNFILWPLSQLVSFWALSYLAVFVLLRTQKLKKQVSILILSVTGILLGFIQTMLSPVIAILLIRLLTKKDLVWSKAFNIEPQILGVVFSTAMLYYLYFILLSLTSRNKKLKGVNDQSSSLVNELDAAQLRNLKMQMRPHFLFNVLNTTSMMIRQGRTDDATEILSSLSDMLRISLDNNQQEFTTLSNEIKLINKLLAIEKFRFEDRLALKLEIDQDTEPCLVPTLIFQPLVENAFKHGVAKTIGEALVHIKTYLSNGKLHLEVYNSGPNLPEDWELQKSQNIGLANTSGRLARLYGSESRLIIEEKESGILVTIIIPSSKC